MNKIELENLEQIINYKFSNKILLTKAITHSSSSKQNNYESLELLGDSILNFLATKWLYSSKPYFKVGKLTLFKSQIINNTFLSEIIFYLKINHFIIVGKNVKINKKITSDVYESLLAAIYLDSNFSTVNKFFKKSLVNNIDRLKKFIDYKGLIINKYNRTMSNKIKFSTNTVSNNNIYISQLSLNNNCYGFGVNKKEAEQNVSKLYLNIL